MRLEVKNWAKFCIGDLFVIRNGKGITKDEIENNPGNFTVIQSGEENNGCMGKIDRQYCIDNAYTLSDMPCLTVAGTGSAGFVSYRKNGCVVGNSAKVLELRNSDKISDNVMIFLQGILSMIRFKYSYGRKVSCDRYLSETIKLPATKNNLPDWQFMENYIKSLHYKPLTTKNKPGNALPLNPSEWKKFRIGDLFNIHIGKRCYGEEIYDNPGDFVVVQAGENNFGCFGKIDKQYCIYKKYTLLDKPCLTLARTGSSGYVSYQKYGCVVGKGASILELKEVNKNSDGVMLFLQTILNMSKFKYSYGRGIVHYKYVLEHIKLPQDAGGHPDWQFMEAYIKSLKYGDML